MLTVVPVFVCFVTVVAQETAQPEAGKSKSEFDPALPNVLILGDSISIGYTPYVKKLLAGKANVYRPVTTTGHAINCGNTKMGLAGLDQWIGTTKWNVIHFNWGLWDMNRRIPHNKDNTGIRDKINGQISFTPEEYGNNIEKIVVRLEKTEAKLIWGAVSFVPDGEEGRVFGDDLVFNDAANIVMKRHHIPVNDLNTLTRTFEPKLMAAPGDVHYTSEGYRKIAKQVTEMIEQQLPQNPHQ
jgi:hypothetical protein